MPTSYDFHVGLHAAFLRGMNVGGHRITNDELRSEFEALGFEQVGTFRASGNVVFEAGAQAEAQLVARIEEGLEEALGYAVPTFVREAEDVRALAGLEPFDAATIAASRGKLQVGMFATRPSAADRKAVLALASDADPLAFSPARELLWLPAGGTLESDLDFKAIEKRLGTSTWRTKGTIDQIAAKFFS